MQGKGKEGRRRHVGSGHWALFGLGCDLRADPWRVVGECGTGPELWLGLDHDCLLRVAKIPLKLCGANESKYWKDVG